ncbi:exosortase B [Duganella sp. FT3S]|uniref:Exosortase B n=1 Tax=Rugamonas fusca TaxID=2758568 RepID=A0A7W2EKS7_9BURK|nr:exosortase B [Rugamonas fusca]MBA5607585.1 exosortase B [Rugamonas fusca]
MNSVAPSALLKQPLPPKAVLQEWLPIVLGFLALFIPSFYTFINEVWTYEDSAHGPIILSLSLWLMVKRRSDMLAVARDNVGAVSAWLFLAIGLFFYVAGRSQQILALEFTSFVWVLAAVILLKFGPRALRVQWFPLFFMCFMIPLPGALVATLTLPMKMAVSFATEHLLYWAGYPIARSGVILQIGQYQLLVADACAGLQTLLALESLGLFYLNVVHHPSKFRNVALALLIVPISFAANVLRVITLTLVTYYLGDAAGQGFLHGFAGMVLFVSALCLILSLDTFLQWLVRRRAARRAAVKGAP